MNVFVLFVTRHDEMIKLEKTPEILMMLSYENVYLYTFDQLQFSLDTPFEEFMRSGRLEKSVFVVSHTSDVLRLLVLWKFGGTYLDTDMIVRQRLDSVPSNFACDDTDNTLNGAILNFSHDKNGRQLAERFMDDLIKNFNGAIWGSNGPLLVTRVLKTLCKTNITKEMSAKGSCDGFHVLPKELCYPISGLSWAKFFNETMSDYAMQKVDNAIAVHFWNNLSKHEKLSVNSSAAYVQLAKQFCPKVISSCGEFFDGS